jgi:hypothetical protein
MHGKTAVFKLGVLSSEHMVEKAKKVLKAFAKQLDIFKCRFASVG